MLKFVEIFLTSGLVCSIQLKIPIIVVAQIALWNQKGFREFRTMLCGPEVLNNIGARKPLSTEHQMHNSSNRMREPHGRLVPAKSPRFQGRLKLSDVSHDDEARSTDDRDVETTGDQRDIYGDNTNEHASL